MKRFKRIISMLLVFAMVFTMLPMEVFAEKTNATVPETEQPAVPFINPFVDVQETDWYYDAVMYAKQNGIFDGTDASNFSPNGTMNRAMYVTVLGRIAGVDTSAYTTSAFTDVATTAYYAPYVAWASEAGITAGTGGGKFSPNGSVTREQMATMTLKYFESFKIPYASASPLSTQPTDLDAISSWAKDAVLKLWQAGLVNGDAAGNFNPGVQATRAEAATFCMRTDKTVAAWKGEEPQKPAEKPDTGGSGTTYYEVTFHAPVGVADVSMPENKVFARGTAITSLPTPYKVNTAFLGWFYDAELTLAAQSTDTLTKNTDLYARFAGDMTPLSQMETPNYVAETDVATNFTFQVVAASEAEIRNALTIKHVSAINTTLEYTIVPGDAGKFTISAVYTGGQTYKAELAQDSEVVFYHNGESQLPTVRVFNFITAKEEVLGLGLDKGLIYIRKDDVSNMTGKAFEGLFSAVVGPTTMVEENTATGTFTYTGDLVSEGDTIAVYAGTRPDLRKLETTGAADGDVAYVTITKKEGTTYTYTSADSTDVMFTPDVLPISKEADQDSADGTITVANTVLDFTDDKYAQAGLDSQTVVEAGDFIALFTGTDPATATTTEYGKILSVVAGTAADTTVITYSASSYDVIMAAMDVYNTRNEEIVLTPAEIKEIESGMETQAMQSGFVEEAASYLTGLALETDGFQEISGDFDLKSYSVTGADGKPLTEGEMSLMAGKAKAEITKKEIAATVAAGKVLQHFDGGYGVRAELAMTFTVEITNGTENKIEITLQAIFEQEVLLSVNVSGGAIWKKAWIFPYIEDYQLNANFDVGTFTGIGITATAKTVGPEADDGYDWKPVTGNKYEQKIINIGKQITDLMEAKETFLGEKMVDEKGEEIEWGGSNGGGLTEKYAAMIENADGSWIELFRKEIFNSEGSVDPFHILVFGISADFVISANMYITLGMTFEYANAKRYNFSLMLFKKQSTNETIDLEEAHYQFDFYVMGTMGIRAGIELEIGVGLFSLKLDSIGLTAELGAYAQLWGYFYYSLKWTQSTGKQSSYSGAMLIDIGIYLKITFKAQLFSCEKLTYQPTLLDKQWPLITIGEQENVNDFSYGEDSIPEFDIKTVKVFTLPTDLFAMQYMDMKTGEIFGGEDAEEDHPAKNCDDATEGHFIISISNPAFHYNPKTNTVTVTPKVNSAEELGEMKLVWKSGTLAFTSKSISRTIPLKWSDPATSRFIAFDSTGGSAVKMLSSTIGAPISVPANPKKQGYTFEGWFTTPKGGTKYTIPTTMPAFTMEERGITVYAKWSPAQNTYKEELYQQAFNGQYKLITTKSVTGLTEAVITPDKTPITGFTYNESKSTAAQTIAANGSTVMKRYFDRNHYNTTLSYGSMRTEETPDLVYNFAFDDMIYAPKVNLGGYVFDGWYDNEQCSGQPIQFMDNNGKLLKHMGASDVNYYAKWSADPTTPYRMEHYIQRPQGDGYALFGGAGGIQTHTGTTGSTISLEGKKLADVGLTYEKATVGGTETTSPIIGADGKTVLKLYYTRKPFDVHYNVVNGTNTTEPCLYQAAIQEPSIPQKAGYIFSGWFSDEGLTTAFVFDTAMPANAVTIYGKLTPDSNTKYAVEHYVEQLNGANTLVSTQSLTGETDRELTLATLASETIVINGGITYKEAKVGETTQKTANIAADGKLVIKLYYQRQSHNLTFDANTGTGGSIAVVKYGAAVTAPTLTKPGYAFAGWFSAATGGTAVTVPGTMPANDFVAFAQWTANSDTKYTVEHYQQNANDSSYTKKDTETLSGITDQTVTATAKDYPNFTHNATAAGTVAAGIITADGGLVLKLYYDRAAFTIGYTVDGGAYGETKTYKYEQTIVHPKAPTKEGYQFDTWQLDGTTFSDTVMPAKNITLAAKWSAGKKSYSIRYYQEALDGAYTLITGDTTPAEGTFDATVNVTPAKVYPGFTKPIDQTVKLDGTLSYVDFKYTRNSYDIVWNAGTGGTIAGNATKTETLKFGAPITVLTPIKTGYTHTWSPVPAGTVPLDGATYTATWAKTNYTITYQALNGVSHSNPTAYDVETPTITLTAPAARVGYTFKGWFDATTGGTKMTQILKGSTGNKTIYAQWEKIVFSITYDGLEGATNHASNPSTYTVEDTSPITLGKPTKQNYAFVAWYTDSALTTPVTTITTTTGGNVQLYAKWAESIFTITYNNTKSIPHSNPTSFKPTDATITLADLAKPGYTFNGWFGAQTGGTRITQILPSSAANQVLYAQWTTLSYSIGYDLGGGGEPEPANPTTYTVETPEFSLAAPTAPTTGDNAGNIFGGWTGTDIATAQSAVTIALGSTGNRTYTANWIADSYTVTYDLDGGAGNSGNPPSYEKGATLTLTSLQSGNYPAGKLFAGWHDEASSDPNSTVTKLSDKSYQLKALWRTASQSEPYIIYDAAGLVHLRDMFNDASAGNVWRNAGKNYFKLENDIALDNTWTPIALFTGQFDGNNKAITIASTDGTSIFHTLGIAPGVAGNVKNLTIEGSIQGRFTGFNVGSIAKQLYVGTIENCTNNASITLDGMVSQVGGIVGAVHGVGAIVKNCTNNGNITLSNSGNAHNLGGIVGQCYGLIESCTNNGTIQSGYLTEVGGIAGSMYSPPEKDPNVKNCRNTGAVTGNGNTGGIVGSGYVFMISCMNTGVVTSQESPKCGGIYGGLSTIKGSPVPTKKDVRISNCLNTAAVRGYDEVGGISGQLATLFNCVNTGTITAAMSGGALGEIIGSKAAGNEVYNSYFLAGVGKKAFGTVTGVNGAFFCATFDSAGIQTVGTEAEWGSVQQPVSEEGEIANALNAGAVWRTWLAWEMVNGAPVLVFPPIPQT